MPNGVLVLDKPRGPTSHDIVARVRRTLGVRGVGHAGTLDPMATGVLVVALGEATKLVPWLTAHQKTYEATIALGIETDTLDADGREMRRAPPSDALRAELRTSRAPAPGILAALEAERRRTLQIPPAFSAIKQDGERAYARARRGEAPELDARPVQVFRLELLSSSDEPPFIEVGLDVAKGYYVRALARDLAEALGTFGHLTSLRRTRSGGFSCDEALSPEALRDDMLARLCPLALAAARTLPTATLTDAGARDARHGRPVQPADIEAPSAGPTAWLDPSGALVAIGRLEEDRRGTVLRGFGNAG